MLKEVMTIRESRKLFIRKNVRFCLMFFVIFLFTSLNVYSQYSRDGILGVTGWVLTDSDEPMRKVSVSIYESGVLVAETKTNRRGRFALELPIDRKYVAEYSSEGYATKKMSFNTVLPNNFKGFNVFYFEFIVELFPWCPGVDYALLETPYIEIAYMQDKEEFFFEEITAKPMLAKVEELKIHTYKMLEVRKDYDLLIAAADSSVNINNLENAISDYRKALDLFPKEEYPQSRLQQLLAQTGQQELVDTSDDMLAEVIEENKANNGDIGDNIEIAKDNEEIAEDNEDIAEDIIVEQIIAENHKPEEQQTNPKENQMLAQQEIAVNIDDEDDEEDSFSEELATEVNDIAYEADTYESFYYTVSEGDKLVAYFDFASYTLDEESIETINQAINHLKNNPDKNLVIYGHTDKRGNSLFNFYLSQLRAQIANEHCINGGIASNRIITVAYGQNMPVLKNARKESEHKLNRRIEIEFVEKDDFENMSKNASQITYRCINDSNKNKKFSPEVEYMVQFIASKKPVGYSYFYKIIKDYPETDIVYYYDNDNLHRYLIGSYNSIDDVRTAAIKLREIGYDAYVVAFLDGKRISLTEARLALEGKK